MKKIFSGLVNLAARMMLCLHPFFYDYQMLKKANLYKKPWHPGWRRAYRLLRLNKKQKTNLQARFPVSHLNTVHNPSNILFNYDDLTIFDGAGRYYQAFGQIIIGKGTRIANNVALITANHDLYNLDSHQKPKAIVLGKNCWIGFGCVILPGVQLGDRTIVGAGSVVTHSFPDGHVVIAGNPAKIIRILEEETK